jgi:VanZ family protein
MAAYGVAIEAIQSLEPTRTAEWKDLFVDVVGILAGLLVYRLIGRFLQPRVPRALEGDVSRPRS